jgi:hypothetical protein
MAEKIFNLFLYISENVIWQIGAAVYEFNGTEDEQIAFLLENAEVDAPRAPRYSVPAHFKMLDGTGVEHIAIPPNAWELIVESGRQLEVFEELLERLEASETPLYCLTPVVDGVPITGAPANHLNTEEDVDDKRSRHTTFLQDQYIQLAAFGWDSHSESGRGALVIQPGEQEGVQISYLNDPQLRLNGFSDELLQMVANYNPQTEFVVSIIEPEEGESDYRLGASNMTPPQASAMKAAATLEKPPK